MQEKILVIKLGALGDFVLTTGAMRTIRERHKEAHITLLTMAPFVEIAKQSGYFDAVEVDTRSRNPLDWWHVCKHLIADGGFSRIYDFQCAQRTRVRYFNLVRFFSKTNVVWACWAAGGFSVRTAQKTRGFCFGKVTFSFLPMTFYEPSLTFLKGPQKYFNELPRQFILMIPGCSPTHPYKRWPAESYIALAQRLARINIVSVVLGTSAEEKEINQIVAATPSAVSFLNKATLRDIPALAGRALLVVGNDTGPMHMAALSGTPSIYLFSERTRSSAQKLSNISNLFGERIEDISPDDVYKVISQKLQLKHSKLKKGTKR